MNNILRKMCIFNKKNLLFSFEVYKIPLIFFIAHLPLVILVTIWSFNTYSKLVIKHFIPLFVMMLIYALRLGVISFLIYFMVMRKNFLFIQIIRIIFFLFTIIVICYLYQYIIMIPFDTIEGWNIIVCYLFYPAVPFFLSIFFALKRVT